ncbi:MAG: hypothetical protein H6817_01035 [Phycisphaerales bacterium]|nr:hypothetical protein [Phycisphaerales bacterium]
MYRTVGGYCTFFVLTILACALPVRGDVRYVDQSATSGANNGTSWANAYLELRDALSAASGAPTITELWVAEGVYKPTAGSDQEVSFVLRNGLKVRGGFAGGETSITQRSAADHITVLSGDINTPGVASDNSRHVLRFANQGATTILETCVITGGRALGGSAVPKGGGALITGSSTAPRFINCRFVGNASSGDGGAVNVEDASPTFVNCTFVGNTSSSNGGAVYSVRGAVVYTNCTFASNSASGSGGAYYTVQYEGENCFTNPVFNNCIFRNNSDSGPQDQSAQIDFDTFFCPPERPARVSALVPTAPIAVNYSFLQGWNGVFGGATNSSADPLLADIDGADNTLGTVDDNVQLTSNSPAIDFANTLALPADVADLDADANTTEAIPFDVVLRRRVNNASVDAGAFEFPDDCNNNSVPDTDDISGGTSLDCNDNMVPDECDGGDDCNANALLDECELLAGSATDCNENGTLDECDIFDEVSEDCDGNGIPDECELAGNDCNANNVLDACDIAAGTSIDCDLNGTPDECQPGGSDCNFNGIDDGCDVAGGTSEDCNENNIPDECELAENDCNANGIPDECDRDCDNSGTPDVCEDYADCNNNGESDACDIQYGGRPDLNHNGVPDDCDPDCNNNGFPDFIDLAFHISPDCNHSGVPDECELAGNDCNGNNIPDECDGLVPGDVDGSGTFNTADNAAWVACLTGPQCDAVACPTPVYAPGCCPADFDGDNDVDLKDFAQYEQLAP